MQRSYSRIGLALLSITATALSVPAFASDKITCGITVRKASEAACTRILKNPTTKTADRFMAYYNRAWYYRRAGALDKSLADFNAAEGIDRDYAKLYLSRALLKHEQRDLEGALDDLDIYVLLEPNDWDGYFRRAIVFRQMGEPKQALKPLRKAMQLKPFERQLKPFYALILLDLGRTNEAVEEARRLVTTHRSDPVSYYVRAVVANQRGSSDNALEDLKKALRKSVLFPAAHALHGLILEGRGEIEAAKKAYQMAMKNGGPTIDKETSQDYAKRRLEELELGTDEVTVSKADVSKRPRKSKSKRTRRVSRDKRDDAQDCRRYIPSAAATVSVPCGS